VDNAYGMFIGYTIGLDPNQYTNDQYRKAVQDKMVLDIQNHVQYIVDKINSLNLSRSSFYVYVLPLNKALEDKKEIMDRLLGGDD
jgi:ACT domain-containing protein